MGKVYDFAFFKVHLEVEPEIILSKEHTEYVRLTPQEALEKLDLAPATYRAFEQFYGIVVK